MCKVEANNGGDVGADGAASEVDDVIQVDKWDGAAVRNALDDELRFIVTQDWGMDEDHALVDGRLALSFLAVAASVFALIWDWYHPFPQSRPVLIACVVAYCVLMVVLVGYMMFYEAGILIVARKKDAVGLEMAKVYTVKANMQPYDDIYSLEMSMHIDGQKPRQAVSATLEKSVACWFDVNGVLRRDLFRKDVEKLHKNLINAKPASSAKGSSSKNK